MRKYLTPLVFLIIATSATAQTKFGIEAGASLSSRTGYSHLNSAPIITFQSSFFVNQFLSKKILLHAKLGYYAKGGKLTDFLFMDNLGNDMGKGDFKTRFDYIEFALPVLFQLANSSRCKFFLGLGPYLSYAISANNKATHYRSSSGNNAPVLADPNFDFNNRCDAGIKFQLLNITQGNFTGGLNFDLGLTNVLKNSNQQVKNNSFGITLGFLFN